MISDGESRFLSSVLAEISAGNPIADIEFTEEELEEYQSRYQDGTGDDLNPKRFFVDTGHQICSDCGAITSNCTCTDAEKHSVYHLDAEFIVDQWCEQLERLDHYQDLYIEETGPPIWTVNAVSREFGVVTFFVVSRTDRIVDVDADILNREFVVSLVEAAEIGEQDYYYMWYQLLSEEHHAELHSEIRDTLTPLSDGICDLDSEIAESSRNAISNNLRKYITASGFERIDAQREVGQIGRTIDFSDIEFAAQNEEDEVILVCGCESSANDIHLHYVVDGEVQPVSECRTAEAAAHRMREKIDRRETLDQRTHDLSGRMKALVVAAATVSVGPIVAAIAGLLDLDGLGLDGYPYLPELFFSVLLVLLFIALILPSLQISLFSWDIRKYRTRLLDQVPFR